jgi:peptidyl-prolyl cis-trans isomerase A (cyclophilin A)
VTSGAKVMRKAAGDATAPVTAWISFITPLLLIMAIGVPKDLNSAGAPAALLKGTAKTPDTVRVMVQTEAGEFVAELYAAKAPVTVANFLKYVDGGHYRGGMFLRTVRDDNQPTTSVKIDVIQADIHPWLGAYNRPGRRHFDPIELERTSKTGLRHEDGTLSMARFEPNSATSSFFIVLGDQPELDYGGRRNADGQGFAAFGRVVDGMEVVRWIHQAPVVGQAIVPPVKILRIERID